MLVLTPKLCDQYWGLEGKHKRTKGLDNVVNIWKNWFGNVPCREITQQKVEKFLADKMEKGRELKDGSVKKRHSPSGIWMGGV